jgi:K+-transporting ATPase A subunit
MFQVWQQVALTLLVGFLISIPTGHYLAKVVTGGRTVFDWVIDPVDNCFYARWGHAPH